MGLKIAEAGVDAIITRKNPTRQLFKPSSGSEGYSKRQAGGRELG